MYIEIPLYTKDPSTSKISILVQKQTLGFHTIVQNSNTENSKSGLIRQDMGTFSRSFYFTITSENALSMDLTPPGNIKKHTYSINILLFMFFLNMYIGYILLNNSLFLF